MKYMTCHVIMSCHVMYRYVLTQSQLGAFYLACETKNGLHRKLDLVTIRDLRAIMPFRQRNACQSFDEFAEQQLLQVFYLGFVIALCLREG